MTRVSSGLRVAKCWTTSCRVPRKALVKVAEKEMASSRVDVGKVYLQGAIADWFWLWRRDETLRAWSCSC
jgi:hypothetical protein